MANPRDFKKTRIGLITATAGAFGLALAAVALSDRTGANAQTANPPPDPTTPGLGGWTESGVATGQTRVVVVPWPTSTAAPSSNPTPVPRAGQSAPQQRTVVVVPRTRVRTRGS